MSSVPSQRRRLWTAEPNIHDHNHPNDGASSFSSYYGSGGGAARNDSLLVAGDAVDDDFGDGRANHKRSSSSSLSSWCARARSCVGFLFLVVLYAYLLFGDSEDRGLARSLDINERASERRRARTVLARENRREELASRREKRERAIRSLGKKKVADASNDAGHRVVDGDVPATGDAKHHENGVDRSENESPSRESGSRHDEDDENENGETTDESVTVQEEKEEEMEETEEKTSSVVARGPLRGPRQRARSGPTAKVDDPPPEPPSARFVVARTLLVVAFYLLLRLLCFRLVSLAAEAPALVAWVRNARAARLRRAVDRLNAARVRNGQNPLSPAVLRSVVLTRRDFSPEDYEALHRYSEEDGTVGSTGADEAEIRRCPERRLAADDDLVLHHGKKDRRSRSCAVCLEVFKPNERVRTIPCFHTFHAECVDPWLRQKAVCPVCKFSAIG